MTITLAHSGKQHSYHIGAALQQAGLLDRFYTSSYIAPVWLQNLILEKKQAFLMRRFQKGLSAPFVQTNWSLELKEMYLRKRYGKSSLAQEAVYQRDINFDKNLAREIASRPSEVYWGFQGSCHDTLIAAKKAGKFTICELATAHVEASIRILGEEARLHPDFADSIDNLVFPDYYQKRLEEEPRLADLTIAASAFTKSTLKEIGIPDSQIAVLPLGFDLDYVPYEVQTGPPLSQRPLKLLYAGTLTQRKGIKYLLNVMRRLSVSHQKAIQLTCIGGIQGSGQGLAPYRDYFEYRPAVSQHTLFGLYKDYDALVLPTLFEGFGLVIVEAMAAGLPVITTPHSMGPEVITQGSNGWVIPIRDEQALEDAIIALRQTSDEAYAAMRKAARQAVLAYTWEAYRHRLGDFLQSLEQQIRPTSNITQR